MDNLKKYLQQHVDELDSDVPGEAVWRRLQDQTVPALPKPIRVTLLRKYAAVACVLAFLITAGYYLGTKRESGIGRVNEISHAVHPVQKGLPVPLTTASTALKTMVTGPRRPNVTIAVAKKSVAQKNLRPKKSKPPGDPAWQIIHDVEQRYAQVVKLQLSRLRGTPVYGESPDYFSAFKQQVRQLETDEAITKKDIRQLGLSDELLEQLINISQQKLNVLKALQAEIGKVNNKRREAEYRPGSSRSYYMNL